MSRKYILVINPGSTSTKVAVFEGENPAVVAKVEHGSEELKDFDSAFAQYDYRLNLIMKWLEESKISTSELCAVVGRGGLLQPIPGGTYEVTDLMKEDLKVGVQGEHPANLGGLLAAGIAEKEGIPAYITDAVGTDEFEDIARLSGVKELPKNSLVHALNVKAVSRRRAKELGKNVSDLNFVVLHLGGGISVASVRGGVIIDATIANEIGPFSANRTGSLPSGDLARMCFSGKYTKKEMLDKILKSGGLISYLNSNDAKEIEERTKTDEYAKLIYDAMLYQIGREAGAYATVLNGKVDNIILTGGMAYSPYVVNYLKQMVGFIAEVVVYPGEDEMDALNRGALRVLTGEEKVKNYDHEVKNNGKKF